MMCRMLRWGGGLEGVRNRATTAEKHQDSLLHLFPRCHQALNVFSLFFPAVIMF